ncbi:MAG: type II toxin-antitoxin system RelE/ParE family toxin [Smithella sp.]
MDKIIKDKILKKLEMDASYDGGYPGGVIKSFRKRLQQIDSAVDERDFYNLRSLNFEKLKGNRQHQYSMRINDQWRLILEFKGSDAGKKIVIIINIEDYH